MAKNKVLLFNSNNVTMIYISLQKREQKFLKKENKNPLKRE